MGQRLLDYYQKNFVLLLFRVSYKAVTTLSWITCISALMQIAGHSLTILLSTKTLLLSRILKIPDRQLRVDTTQYEHDYSWQRVYIDPSIITTILPPFYHHPTADSPILHLLRADCLEYVSRWPVVPSII